MSIKRGPFGNSEERKAEKLSEFNYLLVFFEF